MTLSTASVPPAVLFSPEYYQDPYPTLSWLQEHSPVHEFLFPVGDVRTWMVTRYDDAKAVLADSRYSTEGGAWGNPEFRDAGLVSAAGTILERGIAVVDPPAHTRLRRQAMSAFTTRRVEQWRETVRALVDATLEACARREVSNRGTCGSDVVVVATCRVGCVTGGV